MKKEQLMACDKEALVDELLDCSFAFYMTECFVARVRRRELRTKICRLYAQREELFEALKEAWTIKGPRGRLKSLELEMKIAKVDARSARLSAIEDREWAKELAAPEERIAKLNAELDAAEGSYVNPVNVQAAGEEG
jgi:hypothetical protein